MNRNTERRARRAIVAAVQLPATGDAEFESSLAELRQLAKTLGFDVVETFTQKRAGFDSAGYFGVGKREALKGLVEAERGEVILVDHEISPSQSHTLEK